MGRGGQSNFARKQERKQQRLADKGLKFEEKPRKSTKAALKKELNVRKAIAESHKAASAINLDRKEEDRVLDLLAQLEGVVIEKPRVQFATGDKVQIYTPSNSGSEDKDDLNGVTDSLRNLVHEQAGEEGVLDNEIHDHADSDTCDSGDSDDSVETGNDQGGGAEAEESSESSDGDTDDDFESHKLSVAETNGTDAGPAPGGPVLVGRQKFIRKLIRVERRYVREQQEAWRSQPSAERVVARLRQSLQSPSAIPSASAAQSSSAGTGSSPPLPVPTTVRHGDSAIVASESPSGGTPSKAMDFAFKPAPDKKKGSTAVSKALLPTTPPPPPPPKVQLGSAVRFGAHYDKSGDGRGRPGPAKLLVLPRTTGLDDLLDTLRAKFKATAVAGGAQKGFKYDAVREFSSGRVLWGATALATLADGASLTLFSSAQDPQAGGIESGEANTNANTGSNVEENVCNTDGEAVQPVGQTAGMEEVAAPISLAHENAADSLGSTLNPEDTVVLSQPTEAISDAPEPTAHTPSYWTPPTAAVLGDPTDLSLAVDRQQSADPEVVRSINATAQTELQAAYADPSYAAIRQARNSLPIYQKRDELLAQIQHNQVTIVSGETGSGKTTQLPLYLLEQAVLGGRAVECNIVCTQPRRIAAVTVAERVHYECAQSGPVGSGLVGYQVRLDSRVSGKTRLTYCTTGVLLRRLQDPDCLSKLSHVILDEVHERGVESDFLMTLLKQQAPRYQNLKIILMSATMKERLFSDYFHRCPIVYVSGRTFPVTEHYLEDVHEVVARGQRLQAAERGGAGHGGDGGGAPSPSVNERSWGKRYGKDDPSVLKAPKFDAELVAELVIRIMTTSTQRPQDSEQLAESSAQSETAADGKVAPKKGSRLGKVEGAAQLARRNLQAAGGGDGADHRDAAPDTSSSGRPGTGEAILVFLSGIQAIQKVSRALRQRGILQRLNAQVHVLHGLQSAEQQRKVFRRTQPGEWKIVLATNIAETSVTVEDVTHVVDSGYVKEVRFDPASGISSLQEVFVSRVSARQRAGRAGRVRAGSCWRLYSEQYFQSSKVDEHPLPEIQRVPLEEVVLQVLVLRLGPPEVFLGSCLEPPSIDQIRAALACLIEVGAVLPLPVLPLTALGYHLARMPVDVRIGKMLIYGSLFECLSPVLTIAAALSGKSPFFTPLEADAKEEAFQSHKRFLLTHYPTPQPKAGEAAAPTASLASEPVNCYSDHLAVVNAYNQWRYIQRTQGTAAAQKFCKQRFLAHNVLTDIRALREHFRSHLRQTGLLPPAYHFKATSGSAADGGEGQDDNEGDDETGSVSEDEGDMQVQQGSAADGVHSLSPKVVDDLVRCVLCAGLFPQVARLGRVKEHSTGGGGHAGQRRSSKAVEAVEVTKLFLSDRTEVSLHPTCLISRYTKAILDRKATPSPADEDGAEPSSASHYGLHLTDKESKPRDAFLVYHKKLTLGRLFLFDCTVVPHAALLLFSGAELVWQKGKDRVTVAGWIEMRITELHCVLYRRLQREIDKLLRAKVEEPHRDISERQRLLTRIVQQLVATDS